jgi:exosortase A-associated hydrolase 2
MAAVLQPDFLAGSAGRLLITCFVPAGGTDRWLLFLPPFAEEMNKSRRMMARLGHALAAQGIGLCLPDLFGTGDSGGDFAEADIAIWRRDLPLITKHLNERHGCRRLALGGLRCGALLAMQARPDLEPVVACLLWQPMHKGQQQLTQFLRLRQAAAIMGSGPKETLQELQARLADGETLEVAGYRLSPGLAAGLATAEIAGHCPPPTCPTAWLELSARPEPVLSPVSAKLLADWQGQGADVRPQAVAGDSFWATQELVDAPHLIDASVAALQGALAA